MGSACVTRMARRSTTCGASTGGFCVFDFPPGFGFCVFDFCVFDFCVFDFPGFGFGFGFGFPGFGVGFDAGFRWGGDGMRRVLYAV
jgi:hypothetical protein